MTPPHETPAHETPPPPTGPPTSRAARRAATSQRILAAAQAEFGEHGLEAATIRAIAERAGVDPSLVIQHYGSKRELFAIAVKLPAGTEQGDVGDHLLDVVGVRLGGLPPETRALVRSMLTAPEAEEAMRAFLNERIENLAGTGDREHAQLRAALAVSSILGLTIARHFLQLDGLAEVSGEQLEAVVRPWLTATIDGPHLGGGGPAR